MPNYNSLISNLTEQAMNSPLQQQLAATVTKNSKITNGVCNTERNFARGQLIPSLHAEQRAILSYYGLKVNYNKYRGWYFYDPDYQEKKLDVAVVRVSKNGNLANARPCRKCLQMMQDLGIKKVHYSTGSGDEIITEHVKDMFSINDSSSIRRFDRIHYNYPKNDKEYYKFLLRKNAPKSLKSNNLKHFIRFNMADLLPGCKYSLENKKGKTFFKIEDNNETVVLINIL